MPMDACCGIIRTTKAVNRMTDAQGRTMRDGDDETSRTNAGNGDGHHEKVEVEEEDSPLDEFVDGLVSTRDGRSLLTARRKNKRRGKGNKKNKGGSGQLLTSMEGLIWNADKILEQALKTGPQGIPKGNFASCAGICILSAIQIAFSVSGCAGTGIFMKHNVDGTWSNPVACGLTGLGVGFSLGAALKDALIFLTDFEAVESFCRRGFRVGGKVNV
jgi:hypothetical protein